MRGVVGGQKQHGPCDLIRLADPAERRGAADPRFECLLGLGRRRRGSPYRSTDRTGRYDIDADVARRQFDTITRAIARTPALLAA
jgi:hypothetical protein